MPATILVVEDEAPIQALIKLSLGQAGYNVVCAADAETAQSLLQQALPDLVLLDWMLPGKSGIELARLMKASLFTKAIPVIMLTAKNEEQDKLLGLETGADDYVTKPFSPRELAARIKAVLRRRAPERTDDVVEVDGLRVDPASHRVTGHGARLELGPTEFRILHFLMTHPERVYSRAQLLDHVWGTHVVIDERTVDVHIKRLRKNLATSGHAELIQTVRGAGYRFSQEK